MTPDRLLDIEAAYNAAKTMRDVTAAKRVHVSNHGDCCHDWWVAYGKDESCFPEGTANHWRWFAMILLGLASRADAPYSDDKPTPEVVPEMIKEIRRLNRIIDSVALTHDLEQETHP